MGMKANHGADHVVLPGMILPDFTYNHHYQHITTTLMTATPV